MTTVILQKGIKKEHSLHDAALQYGIGNAPPKRHGHCTFFYSGVQERYRKFIYVRSSEKPHCPCCDGPLRVIGSRKRKVIQSDGSARILIIRRLYCDHCHRVHHELPDSIVPYRRHSSATVESVLNRRQELEAYPCENSTAFRIRRWFLLLHDYFEQSLTALKTEHARDAGTVRFLDFLLPLNPPELAGGWLKKLVRILVNSGRWIQTRSAWDVRGSGDRLSLSKIRRPVPWKKKEPRRSQPTACRSSCQ